MYLFINNYRWGADIIQQGEKERKEREKQRYEEQVRKIETQAQEANMQKRKREEQYIKEYIEQNDTNLWKINNDYPNVFVPITIKNICMLDKVNTLSLYLGEKGNSMHVFVRILYLILNIIHIKCSFCFISITSVLIYLILLYFYFISIFITTNTNTSRSVFIFKKSSLV